MKIISNSVSREKLAPFNRTFFDPKQEFTYIGDGSLGGKAQGLAFIKEIIDTKINPSDFPQITIKIPTLTVITTILFDIFMKKNQLYDIAYSDEPDDRIAHAFQKGDLPTELVGDLQALITKVHQPLAIRSSSLLEDTLYEPFAGIYATKMIPNNQLDVETRFHKLVEAIKFIYASTFFKEAKGYLKATKHRMEDEKMAVIIQEVVGQRYGDRFYPSISGVGKSYNFYPTSRAKPKEGVVDLALGLGKTIVDGGIAWTYSPAYPKVSPPYTINELMKQTQTGFWAVNMGKPPNYDPIHETEYLVKGNLRDAEADDTLRFVVSTYDPNSNKISIGMGGNGPRIINFAPILTINLVPLNLVVKKLLSICEEAVGSEIEIEFAVTLDKKEGLPAKIGFLQVRPMVVFGGDVTIEESELSAANALVASDRVLGNGVLTTIQDIVFVNPETFQAKHSPVIANELEQINEKLADTNRQYLLIGFGRWGSSDSWLGIPVNWGQISFAKVIVEATLPQMNVDLSQGAHFFHNLTSFQVSYFSVPFTGKYKINWDWLTNQKYANETTFIKHIVLSNPIQVKVDGKTGRGVILV